MAEKHNSDDSWNNERIIEFIQNYKSEPNLWNPGHPYYKKKSSHYEAWLRIKDNMSWPVTVQELKRKMASLMAYYRSHMNKYNKSVQAGVELYCTSWFAFSAMNSFLRQVYERKLTDHTELCIDIESETDENDEIEEKCDMSSENKTTQARCKTSGRKKRSRCDSSQESGIGASPACAELQTEPAFEYVSYGGTDDEYDTFGKLIASKIKKLRSNNTREVVMNDIHNLIFRACVMDQREQQKQHERQSTAAQPSQIVILKDTDDMKIEDEDDDISYL